MITLLAILLSAPAAVFEGTVQSASLDAPPPIAVGATVRMDGDLFLNGQPYPVWFEAQNGPLQTWWFAAPGRPEVHRGWVSLSGGWFDGVYGSYPDLYWKFAGAAHAPEPAIAAMLLAGLPLLRRRP